MTKSVFLGVTFLVLVGTSCAQPDPLDAVRVDVVYLSSDDLEGRSAGSGGEMLAAKYIASRFEALGLASKGTDGWFQEFEFSSHPNPHDTMATDHGVARNVIGFLDRGADHTVVVGAHFDHLGFGGPGSRAPGEEAIHNGADDNASGIGGLLEVARQLSEHPPENNNVLFIAFSAEELGLLGSKHFVAEPTIPLEKINYMINMDMVGRLRESLIVGGAGTSPEWIPLLERLETEAYKISVDSSGLGPSDHASFYLKDIPVLHLFTGQHQEYHKPSDDSPLINYSGILDVATLAREVVVALDGPEKIEFTKTKDRSQRRAAAFKVSLGVMPDYAYDGNGLRIDAVIDDRPGADAGLEAGDVVVKIGEDSITDIYSYMDALSRITKGDKVPVTVIRGDSEVESEVEF